MPTDENLTKEECEEKLLIELMYDYMFEGGLSRRHARRKAERELKRRKEVEKWQ